MSTNSCIVKSEKSLHYICNLNVLDFLAMLFIVDDTCHFYHLSELVIQKAI